jgi:glutamate racemase
VKEINTYKQDVNINGAIGVFDSGIGGLSVASALQQLLPYEQLVYVADSKHAPYGEKTDDYIYQRMQTITQFLLSQGAKAIVVACNTATTAAIAKLRAQYQLPIIGVEPGVKPAVLISKSGVVGVLATPRTLQTPAFANLAQRFAEQATILLQACPQLVSHIEALDLHSPALNTLLHRYIDPLLAQSADTLVLGCTHYNFIAAAIAALAGPDISIIRTETAVAHQVQCRLQQAKLLTEHTNTKPAQFYTSGAIAPFRQQLAVLWPAFNDNTDTICQLPIANSEVC